MEHQQPLVSQSTVDSLLKEYGLTHSGGELRQKLDAVALGVVESFQRGGNNTLPGDYFSGALNANYIASPATAGAAAGAAAVDAAAAADVARPALAAYSLQGGAKSRAARKSLTESVVTKIKSELHAFMNRLSALVKNKGRVVGKTHLKKMKAKSL